MRIVRSLAMDETSSNRSRGTGEGLPPRSRLPSFVEVQAGNTVTLASSDGSPLESAPGDEISERTEHNHHDQLTILAANEVKYPCRCHHDDKAGGGQRRQHGRDSRQRRQDDADRSRQLRNADEAEECEWEAGRHFGELCGRHGYLHSG